MSREIPLYTLEGVPDADVSTHHFSTEDQLGLSMLRFQRHRCDDVVLIVHGLTTSSDMFIMPEHYNLVRYLLDHEFTDVWCLDFRMSNRHPYNLKRHRYTLDDVALFDHPAALAAMRRVIGDRPVHVISHCLGAATFAMSVFGRAVTDVTSLVVNSVALTPRVPAWSRLKIEVSPFILDYILNFSYVNPNWSHERGITIGKVFSKVVSLWHRECDVPACHMLSLMWGSGHPALYRHENLADVTHRRGGDLYGGTSVHYYRHVRKMLRAGNRAVKYDPSDRRYDRLPDDYLRFAPEIETPVLFLTGDRNNVFRDSNILCHQTLERLSPGRHQLCVYPGYGHQDPFMGKNVATDIFPPILDFLNQHRGSGQPGATAAVTAPARVNRSSTS